jgi:COMPASS component BRE2
MAPRFKNVVSRSPSPEQIERLARRHPSAILIRASSGLSLKMSAESPSTSEALPTTVPSKRAPLDDDHQPAVSSPLNPDLKPKDEGRERAPRAKKDTLKKREAKASSLAPDGSGRGTPDPKGSSSKKKIVDDELAPIRYKLGHPKSTDFEAPRPPIWVYNHTKTAPDGTEILFNEDPDQ